jgi:4,5-DOPA dioxygenase extradiol
VAAGAAEAAGESAIGTRLHASVTYGCLAMDAYAFGANGARLQQALATASASA